MLAHVDLAIQVPGRAAVAPGFPLARQPHPAAVLAPGGHSDRALAGAADPPPAAAGIAGTPHDPPPAAATRTALLQPTGALGDPHQPGVTVLIVGRALVRVGEHLAGFLRLLEGLLRLPIVGVAVGVILHREPAVGLLDLGLGRRPRYVEYLVVIALRHRRRLRGLASLV